MTGLAGVTTKGTMLVAQVRPLGNLVRLLGGLALVRLSAVRGRAGS